MANSAIEMIFTPRWYTVAQVTVAQLWGEQGSHADHHWPAAVDQGRRSARILPEWVEAYVQDRAKASEDIW